MTRADLLAAIQAGRARLDDALGGLPDAAMLDRIDDTWTRKDVVAHLAAWERHVVDLLERLRAGDEPAAREPTDVLNARFHAADRARPLGEVLAAERSAYDRLVTAVAAASDEELFDGDHFAWTAGDPLADWFRGNSDEHYAEHLEQLTRAAR
jgi:hypothetical protein